MVIKLLKHELIRIARIAAIPAVIMIVLAILFRISMINYISTANFPVVICICVFYIFSVFATLAVCLWVGVVRFYRTLFTREGYMTLSLPVTANQLIGSKLLASIIAVACGVIICTLSALILFLGQQELVIRDLSHIIYSIGIEVLIFIFMRGMPVENVIYCIVLIPLPFLLCYLVMALAQLFTVKNRTVLAVVIYVGGSFVWSIFFNTVGTHLLNTLENFSVHLMMWVQILFVLAVDIVSYCVVRYIIKNKINLLT